MPPRADVQQYRLRLARPALVSWPRKDELTADPCLADAPPRAQKAVNHRQL